MAKTGARDNRRMAEVAPRDQSSKPSVFVRRSLRGTRPGGGASALHTFRSIAGLPPSRWLFALRIWLAVNLAIGVGFWLQLSNAFDAGVTVAILAMQTRGQILEKSAFRIVGTVIGGVVSIAIVGLFAQTRDLYMIVYSAWLGLCVFAASFLDGFRAYGAVICGYTVSVVAITQIDDPGSVFAEVSNRCAAITVGIASITLVIDLLRGPEIGPRLIAQIGMGRSRVHAFTDKLLREGPGADMDSEVAAMLRAASDQHPLLNALPVEAVSGSARAGAVRATLAALVGEVRTARALALADRPQTLATDPKLRDLVVRRFSGELTAKRERVVEAFAAAQSGLPVTRAPRMPIYRSRENAVANGLRAFLAIVLAGYAFVLTGWPETSLAWGIFGIMICISSNAPDQVVMTKGLLVAFPGAVALAGITEFILLDGVDAFPMLMIGTAPALFVGSLMASSPKPAWSGTGMLLSVFTLVIFAPSNPQSYDPKSYLLGSILILTAGLLVFALVRVLFPTTDTQRRRWALEAVRRDLQNSLKGREPIRPEDEFRLLDASRIGTLVGLKATRAADLAFALRASDLALVARRIRHGLDRLVSTQIDCDRPRQEIRSAALVALAMADAKGLRHIAKTVSNLVAAEDDLLVLAADLAWAAVLIGEPAEHVINGPAPDDPLATVVLS